MSVVRLKPFTLLEMIVATAVFALLAMTSAMALHSIVTSWHKMQLRAADLDRLLMVDRVVDAAFRNAIPFTWPAEGGEKPVFIGDSDKVTLAYMHRIGEPEEGGIRFMSLRLDNGNLVATYRKTPIVAWNDDPTGNRVETLATDVGSISFLYAERIDDQIEWNEDWDEETNANLPLAIQLTLKWRNGAEERWLRRTAGSGPFESLGVRRQTQK